MANKLLYDMRHFMQQLIDMLSSISGFDFFIIDKDLLRIAGTGEYKKYIGLRLPVKCANAYVLEKGEPLIIYNPLEHQVCIDCSRRDECYEETMMIYPIRIGEDIVGTVALSSLTQEKKDQQKIIESDLRFLLQNISSFLALKVKDEESFEISQYISNSIDEGIILTDISGIVLFLNDKMNKYLNKGEHIDAIFVNHKINEIIEKGKGYENRELENEIRFENKKIFVSAKPIMKGNCVTEILFVFRSNDFNNLIEKTLIDYTYRSTHLKYIIGNSKIINNIKDIAIKASQSDSNVLIRGESGTGKEVVARAIHNMSKNNNSKFIAVNCAAIPENLLESELFGYDEGAFTGAKKGGKPGLFEMANDGTIFLDEIGDLPLHLQPKLLRAIESRSVTRVGGTKPFNINARIIAATNRDLEKEIEEEKFRNDLYYRLNVIPISLPPLRKRPEDIITLARFFLSRYTLKFNKEIVDFSEEVERIILLYNWPGNVRELENVIEYIVNIESTSIVQITSLPNNLINNVSYLSNEKLSNRNLKNIEKEVIQELLDKYEHDVDGKIKVAKELGISLSTLYRKLKIFNILM